MSKPRGSPQTPVNVPASEPFEPKGSKYERLLEKKVAVNDLEDGVSPRLKHLYARSLTIVAREIKHLRGLSLVEKLPSKFANDLIGYVRLLGEMKKQQRDLYIAETALKKKKLESIPDDELEAEVKKLLKGKNK